MTVEVAAKAAAMAAVAMATAVATAATEGEMWVRCSIPENAS